MAAHQGASGPFHVEYLPGRSRIPLARPLGAHLFSTAGLASFPAWLPRSIGLFLVGWLVLSGGLLLVRSSLGTADRLDAGQAILSAVMVITVAFFSRAALLSQRPQRGRIASAVLPQTIASVGLVIWGLALTIGAGSTTAAGVYWLLFLVEEVCTWCGRWLHFRRLPIDCSTQSRPAADGRIIQQFTRLLTADEEEVIRGTIAVRIERGSRAGVAHIAFCPPFAERPEFDVHFAEKSNATVKFTQLYAHGTRVEVRLPQAAQAETAVVVRFLARYRSCIAKT